MDENEIVNILCATDNNYISYCGIMLTSVFETNKHVRVDAYIIIDEPLPKNEQKRFAKLATKYNNSIYYLQIDKSITEKFPVKGSKYWTNATYYRLYASEMLPNRVHRVLYFDCDVIVNGKLDNLWQVDMINKAVGCVYDIFDYNGDNPNRLNYPIEAGYFNAGVLLINLDYCREHTIWKKYMDILNSDLDLVCNDQDVLNAALWDKKVQLPITYNFQIQFLKHYFYDKSSPWMQLEIQKTKDNPVVIHYASPRKPWNVLYYKMPYKQIWEKYKQISPWRYMLPRLPDYKVTNYIVKRFLLWPLGLMWQDEYISY